MDLESALELVASFSSSSNFTERIADLEIGLTYKKKNEIEKILQNER